MIEITALIVFPALMAYAAASDLLTMTIPNKVSLALVLTFAAFAVFGGLAWDAVLLHVAAGALVLIVCFGMFAFGWIGGGDAKLLAGCALWLGLPGLAPFLFWTTVAGGVMAAVLLVARRHAAQFVGSDAPTWIGRLFSRQADVPYGVAIAFGALMAFRHGALATGVIWPF